jgi:hypothetical protein
MRAKLRPTTVAEHHRLLKTNSRAEFGAARAFRLAAKFLALDP